MAQTMHNEALSVSGNKVSGPGPRFSDEVIKRSEMTAMSIRTTTHAAHEILKSLGLDIDALKPDEIQHIVRNAMMSKWRMSLLKTNLSASVEKVIHEPVPRDCLHGAMPHMVDGL